MMKIIRTDVKSLKDFELLKQEWELLQEGNDMTVFQSYDWNRLLFLELQNKMFGKFINKVVVYQVFDESEITMILPLYIHTISNKIKWIGKKRGLYLLGNGSYSDYLNAIYMVFDQNVFSALLEQIHRDYPKLSLFMTDVRDDTNISMFLKRIYGVDNKIISVAIKKPESIETYNNSLSKSTKQNLRTALNRMKKGNISYRYEIFGKTQDIILLNSLKKIHIDRMEVKMKNNVDILHLISSKIRFYLKKQQELHNNIVFESMQVLDNSFLLVVYLNDNIAGYLYGLKDRNKVRIVQNCFDQEYAFYSPLFRAAYDYIVTAFECNSLDELDFTRGDEPYKYKLGGVETELSSFILF